MAQTSAYNAGHRGSIPGLGRSPGEGNGNPLQCSCPCPPPIKRGLKEIFDFLGGSDGKVSAYSAGDLGSIPGWGRSLGVGNGNPLRYSCPHPKKRGSKKYFWRRKWQSTAVLLPGKSNGQRSLAGYSPLGRKELDTTEWLHFTFTKDLKVGAHAPSCHLFLL